MAVDDRIYWIKLDDGRWIIVTADIWCGWNGQKIIK
jgi:hypothetical protein